MHKKSLFPYLFLLIYSSLIAQNTTTKDTVFLGVKGNLTKEHILSKDIEQFKFDFKSTNTNNLHKSLKIDGQYVKNVKDGRWSLTEQNFVYKLHEITTQPQMNTKLSISGNEFQMGFGYRNGKPFGKWKLDKIIADEDVSLKKQIFEAQFNTNGFPEGKLVLAFFENGFMNTVNAQLNEKGFFNGKQEFIYKHLDEIFKEERIYDNGFLISLKLYNQLSKEVVLNLTYEEVVNKLNAIRKSKELNFQVSERGFGVDFNIGYSAYDVKLTAQQKGNAIVDTILKKITHYEAIDNDSSTLVFNLTRRFKIAYPEKDSLNLFQVEKVNRKLINELDSIVNNPRYILNQQKTKKLTEAFVVLENIYFKANKIDSLIRLNSEGAFDFISRDTYFGKGLPGLTSKDTISYSFDGKEFTAIIDFISYNKNLSFVDNIYSYANKLIDLSKERFDYSKSQLQQFDKEAKIELLDSEILKNILKYDTLYTPLQELHASKEFNDRPYSYNILEAIKTRFITPNHKKYIDEKDLNKKIELGREMMCLMGYVFDHSSDIFELDSFKANTDKMFTRFSDNPFLDRMMETKVYPNIFRKSTEILFTNYINGVLRSSSCAELEQSMMKIVTLENKLEELSNKNDKSVQELDRVLRRENVPTRIERLMELN